MNKEIFAVIDPRTPADNVCALLEKYKAQHHYYDQRWNFSSHESYARSLITTHSEKYEVIVVACADGKNHAADIRDDVSYSLRGCKLVIVDRDNNEFEDE